jgi:hypothetical protein
MTYRDFDFPTALSVFALDESAASLFPNVTPIAPSDWLRESVARGLPLAQAGLEKARSEFLIAPILAEVHHRHASTLMLHSGRILDVDRSRGLTGECDFLFSRGTAPHVVRYPILAVVEAKKDDLETGLGQCVTQLVAARLANQRVDPDFDAVFGCVTTGNNWQFLRLVDTRLTIDSQIRYVNELPILLGIFDEIISHDSIG